jgi:hypothetical protein
MMAIFTLKLQGVGNQPTASQLELSKLKAAIFGLHIRTFAVDSIFDQQLDFSYWQQAIEGIERYVKANSRNILNMQSRGLIDNLSHLKQLSKGLESLIKIGYRGRSNYANLEMLMPMAMKILNAFIVLIKEIDGTYVILENKKNAKQILLIAAQIMKSTSFKVAKEINERIKQLQQM